MNLGILQVIVFLIRASLATVLIAAGAAKLADTHSFATTLTGLGMPLRRKSLIQRLALLIPLLEISLGLAVVSGLRPMIINSAVIVLMCCFTIVVIIALRKELKVSCRCFGALIDSQFSGKGLAHSLLLTVLAIVVFWDENLYAPQLNISPNELALLGAGFLLFALAITQAAKTIAVLKGRSV